MSSCITVIDVQTNRRDETRRPYPCSMPTHHPLFTVIRCTHTDSPLPLCAFNFCSTRAISAAGAESWRLAACYRHISYSVYVIVTPLSTIPVDSGVTNLIHDSRSCVDFTLEVEVNVARCVHSSVNKPGVKCNSGL